MAEDSIEKLQRDVQRLSQHASETVSRADLQMMQSDVGKAERKVSELDERVESAGSRLDVESDERRAADERLSNALEDIAARVDGVVRHLRAVAGGTAAPLDDVDVPAADLARRAERAAHLADAFLPDEERAELRRQVEGWPSWCERRRTHRGELERASRVIASTDPGDDAHRRAGQQFHTVLESLDRLEAVRDTTQAAANEAAARLAEDDALRERAAKAIADGKQARKELDALIKRRISDAVNSGQLLPVWYDTALGMTPSRRDPDLWLRRGTSVVAYRITYGVDDPVVTLGPGPTEGWPRPRLHWYRQLQEELRRDW